jgi:CheY-like chemotaxis protein
MNRILLVDDSPHAQRMGERILSEEGYEVVAVSNADSALIRMEDVDPDVILADVVMPGRGGYEICQYVKMSPRHRRVRVILTAGAQEPFDDARVTLVEADGILKKPFEASILLALVKPLAEAAARERSQPGLAGPSAVSTWHGQAPAPPFVAVVDSEQVRAAVTVALDAAMENMVSEITGRVFAALQPKLAAEPVTRAAASAAEQPAPDPVPELPQPAAPPRAEGVRRVTSLRHRSGSILGLDTFSPEPEDPGSLE